MNTLTFTKDECWILDHIVDEAIIGYQDRLDNARCNDYSEEEISAIHCKLIEAESVRIRLATLLYTLQAEGGR